MYHVPGPVSIKFNALDLGISKGGVHIQVTTHHVPFGADKYGLGPASFIFGGKTAIVHVIGMTPSVLQTANIWDGNVLQNGTSIGKLASASAHPLIITENDGTSVWTADLAFPSDPEGLDLKSTQELNLPLTFLIIPNSSGQLFSSLPTYIAA